MQLTYLAGSGTRSLTDGSHVLDQGVLFHLKA